VSAVLLQQDVARGVQPKLSVTTRAARALRLFPVLPVMALALAAPALVSSTGCKGSAHARASAEAAADVPLVTCEGLTEQAIFAKETANVQVYSVRLDERDILGIRQAGGEGRATVTLQADDGTRIVKTLDREKTFTVARSAEVHGSRWTVTVEPEGKAAVSVACAPKGDAMMLCWPGAKRGCATSPATAPLVGPAVGAWSARAEAEETSRAKTATARAGAPAARY
jgi:hypothetical protein